MVGFVLPHLTLPETPNPKPYRHAAHDSHCHVLHGVRQPRQHPLHHIAAATMAAHVLLCQNNDRHLVPLLQTSAATASAHKTRDIASDADPRQ